MMLLSTKWSPPRAPTGLVRRSRLTSMFDAGRDRRLTLVSAPAGYGKTTAVVSWLQERNCPFVWLSLDEHDTTLAQTFAYLVSAFRATYPDAFQHSWSAAHTSLDLPLTQLADIFLTDLGQLPGNPILVLDDFQMLTDQETFRFMRRVVEHLPPSVQIVIISRTDPPLKLNLLRGRGLLSEIRASDLRFTNEESAVYLSQEDQDLSKELAARFNEGLEGWAAGLQLLAINLRAQGDPVALAHQIQNYGHQLAQDFLLSEVFQTLTVPLRGQLLRISPFHRFSAGLCDYLLGLQAGLDGNEFIQSLIERNLFVVPLDKEGRWYRFHHLFRLLLYSRFRWAEDAVTLSDNLLKGSQWFEEQGEISEAIIYAVEAGDETRAVRLIRIHCHEAFNRADWLLVKQWLELLPESARHHSDALVVQVMLQQIEYRTDAIPVLLEEAQRKLAQEQPSPENQQEHEASVTFLNMAIFWPQVDLEARVVKARMAVAQLPPHAHYWRGSAEIHVVLTLHMLGRSEEAATYLYEVIRQESSIQPVRLHRLLLAWCSLFFATGDVLAVQDVASDALSSSQKSNDGLCIGWFNFALGWSFYEMNQLAAAESHLRSVIEMRYDVHRRAVSSAFACLAILLMADGRPAEAQQIADDFRQFLQEGGLVSLNSLGLALHTRLNLSSTHVRDELTHDPEAQIFQDNWEIPILTAIRHAIRQGSPADLKRVDALLQQCRTFAKNIHFDHVLIRLDILEAWRAVVVGDESAALDFLQQAIDMARSGGMLRVFHDQGWDPADLLLRLQERTPDDLYLAQVLAVALAQPMQSDLLPAARQSMSSNAGLEATLTNRETDILLLLERRLTNKEIANKLSISPHTVKKHTINLYQKLDVINRRQAVAAARSLGLLPDFPTS